MGYFYILYSQKIDQFYTGHTDDLDWRLERHNAGWGKYTKRGIPWILVYYETFATKQEAIRREREVKRMKSRKYIENLIKGFHAGGRPDPVGKSRRLNPHLLYPSPRAA